MAISFVQQNDLQATAATTVDVTLTGVGAGALIVLNSMNLSSGADRTLTVTDITNSDTVLVAVAEPNRSGLVEAVIDYIPSATGGDTTYRLTTDASTTIELEAMEFSHDGTATLDTSGKATNASGTTHVCAASGEIDTAANAMVVMCIQFSGTLGGGTNPSGYTMSALAGRTRSGYKGPGTYTDENASQTTVNSRVSAGAVASFAEVGGGPTYNYQNALMTLGVGT